jgi:RNA polymerase sigma factor (sigma-70 family)
VSSPSDAVAEIRADEAPFNLEAVFCAQYESVARVIARVVRDRGRAEELAVEVFLKLSRHQQAQGKNSEGWLYRVAVRMALDELRREARWNRYQHFFGFARSAPTPEDIHAAAEKRYRVRLVLGSIPRRYAELLILYSQDFSYNEMAVALNRNRASIGTQFRRAQQTFKQEYIKRYGDQ